MIRLYAIGILLIVIVGMGIALKVKSSQLEAEEAAHVVTKNRFNAFVTETQRLGEAQQKKTAAEKARDERVSKERTLSYENRLAHVNDAYKRLRDGRTRTGGGGVPQASGTAQSTDGAADSDRLLELLYQADLNTAKLIELQEWVRGTR